MAFAPLEYTLTAFEKAGYIKNWWSNTTAESYRITIVFPDGRELIATKQEASFFVEGVLAVMVVPPKKRKKVKI